MKPSIDDITVIIGEARVQVSAQAAARAYLEKLMAAAPTALSAVIGTAAEKVTLPPIGTYWQGQGGLFAGLMRGEVDHPDYALVMAQDGLGKKNWDSAMFLAGELLIDGHGDFDLPTRKQQALLFANLAEHFEAEPYWSSEQYAGFESSAWGQDFGYGYQCYWYKGYEFRARAVRRVII